MLRKKLYTVLRRQFQVAEKLQHQSNLRRHDGARYPHEYEYVDLYAS